MTMPLQNELKPGWQRPFYTIWIGQAFSLLGSTLVQFALVWWLTKTTGSAKVLASATIMALLPEIILGPFVGALVDRWNRRLVMIIADSGIAMATLGLVILFWSGLIQPWHIYVAMLLRSLGGSFHWPAMQATTSLMVPNEHLARVSGLNQAMRGLTQIIGPPLGALLMELLPIFGVLSIDILTAVMAVLPLVFIAVPQPPRLDEIKIVTPAVLWQDVKVGFRFVAAWPGLLSILLIGIALNCIINPAFNMMPLMVTNHFHKDAWLLSAFDAAGGIGMLVGGLSLGIWGGIKNRIFVALGGTIVMCLFIILLGFTPPSLYILATLTFFIVGAANTVQNALFFAAVQGKIPSQIQGRVFTLFSSATSAMVPLAMLVAAFLVDKLGIMFLFKFAGIAGTAGTIFALTIPAIRNFEKAPAPEIPTSAEGALTITEPESLPAK
jgi:MFS transporter, DHA3 family, macrolide efflux protein